MLAEKKKEKWKENKEGKFNNIYTESMEDSPIVGESKGIVDKSWSWIEERLILPQHR